MDSWESIRSDLFTLHKRIMKKREEKDMQPVVEEVLIAKRTVFSAQDFGRSEALTKMEGHISKIRYWIKRVENSEKKLIKYKKGQEHDIS